ncbi:FAD/NAD(P)-binding domain-containing protein [Xylariaceae sp. FL1272]|nr:FAD/NAD(P)-binding domain-containing protein [Xylariaceae sp. FL1272]
MAGSKSSSPLPDAFDVVIIGAGIAGINCTYRLHTEMPHVKLAVFEARSTIGGTWDLYRYPGVRSDSDMYSMAFAWHPWSSDRPIATGDQIMEYLTAAVSKHRLDQYIQFKHRVVSANWSPSTHSWELRVDTPDGQAKNVMSRWLVLGTGYYDYAQSMQPQIPSIDSFKGTVINPQFWPADFDYTGKKVAVIGSGATAVSLVPALPDRAAQVTMIQRSPTFIVAAPNTTWATRLLPRSFVNAYRRIRYIILPYLIVLLCQYFPDMIRDTFRKDTISLLPKNIDPDIHFKPQYKPWDQRICLDPDGAFYKSLHRSNVELVTGQIEAVMADAIKMENGEIIAADTIVTATGFRMEMGGKITLSVDNKPVLWSGCFIWNGAMLDAVPNMMFMLGYTNHAWTLGADNTAHVLIRLMNYMERRSLECAVAVVPPNAAADTQRMWQLSSTYVLEADSKLPVYGMTGNWRPRNRPPLDYIHARWGDYTSDLVFTP